MTEFEAVQYFTELAIQANAAILGLFSLHATILVGATGWAVSQRSHAKGVPALFLPVVALTLAAFFAVNLMSLQNMYDKLNAVLEVLRAYWQKYPAYSTAMPIFEQTGALTAQSDWLKILRSWQLVAVVIDVLAVVFICFALSDFRRSAR